MWDIDIPINWYHGKDGWYTFTIQRTTQDARSWIIHYKNAVLWIIDNVDGPFKHAGWTIKEESAIFKFRHELPYMMFVLRWS